MRVEKTIICAMGREPRAVWNVEIDGECVGQFDRKWIAELAVEMHNSNEIEITKEFGVIELDLLHAGADLECRKTACDPERRAQFRARI